MAFKLFDRRKSSRRAEDPFIRIGGEGYMYVSTASRALLKRKYVELYMHNRTRTIALRPVERANSDAYTIHAANGMIWCPGFLKQYGIDPGAFNGKHLNAKWAKGLGMLLIKMGGK